MSMFAGATLLANTLLGATPAQSADALSRSADTPSRSVATPSRPIASPSRTD